MTAATATSPARRETPWRTVRSVLSLWGVTGPLLGVVVGVWIAKWNGIRVASADGVALVGTLALVYGLGLTLLGGLSCGALLLLLGKTNRSRAHRVILNSQTLLSFFVWGMLFRSYLAAGRPRSVVSFWLTLLAALALVSAVILLDRFLKPNLAAGAASLVALLVVCGWAPPTAEPRVRPPSQVLPPSPIPSPDQVSAAPRRRVLLIGFDGLDPAILKEFMARDGMPHFRRIMEGGAHAASQTLFPTASPIIWTTIATGKMPDKHGIRDFVEHLFPGVHRPIVRYPERLGYQRAMGLFRRLGWSPTVPPTSDLVLTKTVWDILSHDRKTAAVFNWWASWPATSVNGVTVSDRFYFFHQRRTDPESAGRATYPPQLYDRLGSVVVRPGDLKPSQIAGALGLSESEFESLKRLYPEKTTGFEATLRGAMAMDETYLAAAEQVLGQARYDFAAVYLRGIDIVSHGLNRGPTKDAKRAYRDQVVAGYYHRADDQLGALLQFAGDDTDVLVCSDHGFATQPDGTFGHLHAPDGVFILYGPDAVQGKAIPGVRVQDYAPTILYLLDEAVGQDMDGKVLAEAVRPERLAQGPPAFVPTHDRGIREVRIHQSVVDRDIYEGLRALGYVD